MLLPDLARRMADSLPAGYDACVGALRERLEMTNLLAENHPIVRNIGSLDEAGISKAIVNYSAFSEDAILMLTKAATRSHPWQGLHEEVKRNIEEEMGRETQGVPHLVIMREGYRDDLGLETTNARVGPATEGFLWKMHRFFNQDDLPFLAGALLAFETTANPEFVILDRMVKGLCDLQGKKLGPESRTRQYIDGHLVFEVGHEEGLKQAIRPYIDASNLEGFVRGYISVCFTMHDWWEGLHAELKGAANDTRRLRLAL